MAILRHAALAVLPILAGAAMAQAPAAPAPQGIPGLSPQGSAIALTKLHQSDALLKPLVIQMRDASQQLQLEGQRPTINAALIGTLIKKLDGLQSQVHAKQADAVVQALLAVPAADRAPFLKVIVFGQRPTGATPPAH